MVILLVDNTELQKIFPFFKPKGSQKSPIQSAEQPDEFYVDPSFLTDDQVQKGVVEDNNDNEYEEIDEEGIGAF